MAQLRLLDLLMDGCKPTYKGKGPLWHAKPPAMTREAVIPSWNWKHAAPAPDDLVTLDCNGAFLAPLSGCEFSLNGLKNTGPRLADPKRPGYWLVDYYAWQDTRIVSPLGGPRRGTRVWVTTPTLEILLMLEKQGYWPEIQVYDSWTDRDGEKVRMTAWATAVKALRAAAINTGNQELVDEVKTSYSTAITMMLGMDDKHAADAKSIIRRPDWNHTIRAQHAANMWRKAWNCLQAGTIIWKMRYTDELVFSQGDIEFLAEIEPPSKAFPKGGPLKFDLTGLQLGAFKIKEPDADQTEDQAEAVL